MKPSSPSRPSGAHDNYETCPLCQDTGWHFYLNRTTGGWDCKKCGRSGYNAVDLENQLVRYEEEHYVWHDVELPDHCPLTQGALAYLAARGITQQYAEMLGLVESTGVSRIIMPYFSRDGKIIYWNSRDYTGTASKKYIAARGKHPLAVPIWAGPLMPTPPVVLVEGYFDAVRVTQAGFMGVGLGGKSLARHLRRPLRELLAGRPATICLDADALQDALKLQKQIPGTHIATLPQGMDPGGMDLGELRRILQ